MVSHSFHLKKEVWVSIEASYRDEVSVLPWEAYLIYQVFKPSMGNLGLALDPLVIGCLMSTV